MSRRGASGWKLPVKYMLTLLLGSGLGMGATHLLAAPSPPMAPRSVQAPAVRPAARRLAYQGHTYDTYEADLTQSKLHFFFQQPDGTSFSSLGNLRGWLQGRGKRLVFATNAGMFTPARRPVGLYVEEGRELVGLNTQEDTGNFFLKPNAVFFVTETGAGILESGAYEAHPPAKVLYATQSGPALLLHGKVHPAFREGSRNLSPRRSGVGIIPPNKVVFAIANQEVNLHEFASFFRDQFGCQDALYLDGVVSRMYLPALGRDELDGDFGAMIAISEPVK
ncbi:phosphodiester glycosidase family protein [Stigmatella sp. ncwal1]|uniref:Phosphodiester glycosidase family protein n=1 Tax=Stigmatella ashevillensis TaxID=2995309 RepID=A0ABT5DMT6_9BACT|nr:phosphodiester glycosidase family protein [Stigmatella ashevillena]MDC0714923.1 phosphodiester glycosidase family protein [Stigmatella ashevillena]